MRLVVYTDSVYRERDGRIFGEVAFTLFLAALAEHVERLTIIGRLDPEEGPAHYLVPDGVEFVALPHYRSLTSPFAVLASVSGSLRAFWRALSDSDSAWLFGPYLHSQLFALLVLARRRKLVLGVRQDFPAYVRLRRPTSAWMHTAADVLELTWRIWARRVSTVVVGPDLKARYRRSRRLLAIAVSLITDRDVEAGEHASSLPYNGELRLLSVGRLDEEKNPLLLPEILAALDGTGARWRLVVCGEGPLREQLRRRIEALGLSAQVELRGHVDLHSGLLELYRGSHAFVHVSLTEGFPQVLLEAFASGVPVVATDVGGVREAVGAAAVLIPPKAADAAADAILRVTSDAELRDQITAAGFRLARAHTLDSELAQIIDFMAR